MSEVPFPLAFATALFVIAVFIACIKFIAEAGDKAAAAHLKLLRDATPPHSYTRDDGTKGNWP